MKNCAICDKHRSEAFAKGELTIFENQDFIVSHLPPSDEQPLAFLGYCFIEPKRHLLLYEEFSDEQAQMIGLWTKKISQAHSELLQSQRTYFFKFADLTPHFHIHLYPRHPSTPENIVGEAVRFWQDGPKGNWQQIAELCQQMQRYFV